MTRFTYDTDQRAAIIASLPGAIHFGTNEATDDEIIAALEACACRYIKRKRMTTVDGVRRKLEALELVASLLDDPADELCRARIASEVELWTFELYLAESQKRDRRARLHFMSEGFSIFSGFADAVVLSDADTPTASFFRSAIEPVCEAAGEAVGIRQAITEVKRLQDELRLAEVDFIRAEMEYAANDLKS